MLLAASIPALAQSPSLPQRPEIYVLAGGTPESIDVEIALGGTRSFTVANSYMFLVGSRQPFPLDSPPPTIQWSVDPAGKGVTIDASGRMSVAPDATPGVYTLRGVIPEKTMTREVRVYDPRQNPLVGTWHEAAQLACGDGRELEPADRMGELIFAAGGSFTATWRPFETRIDYAGTYEYVAASGVIALTIPVRRQNEPHEDITQRGTAAVDAQGRLILKGVWLASPPYVRAAGAPDAVKACGHVFVH